MSRYTTSGKQVFETCESYRGEAAFHVADAVDEKRAAKIAEALNLVDASPQFVIDRIDQSALDELCKFQPGRMTLVHSPRPSLPDSEILTRAREAAIAHLKVEATITEIRAGGWDDSFGIAIAIRALRDLAKPLEEIVPAVDDAASIADWGAVEDLLAKSGDPQDGKEFGPFVGSNILLAAIRRGRELERALAIDETRAAIEREMRS